MDKDIKIIFNKLENMQFNEQRYVDLSNANIKNKSDLVEVCNIFRDPRYETFRIFYIKDNKIVGHEAITSRMPNAVKVFALNTMSKNSFYRCCEKMKNRIKRLQADGYYLEHNHATESAIPSQADMKITQYISKSVEGFLGHIVLGSSNKYSIIEKDSYGIVCMPKEETLNKNDLKMVESKLEQKNVYDIKISSRVELVALIEKIQSTNEYSLAILTDCRCNVRMILDIPNRIFNLDKENLNGFFKNVARNCGATRVFIGTQDLKTYNRISYHQEYGTIKDSIFLEVQDGKIYSYKNEYEIQKNDLFDEISRYNKKSNRER